MDWPVRSASSLMSSRSIAEVDTETLLMGAGINALLMPSSRCREPERRRRSGCCIGRLFGCSLTLLPVITPLGVCGCCVAASASALCWAPASHQRRCTCTLALALSSASARQVARISSRILLVPLTTPQSRSNRSFFVQDSKCELACWDAPDHVVGRSCCNAAVQVDPFVGLWDA